MTFEELKRDGVPGETILTYKGVEYLYVGWNAKTLVTFNCEEIDYDEFSEFEIQSWVIKPPESEKLYLWAVKGRYGWSLWPNLKTENEARDHIPEAQYRKLMELPSE